MFHFIYHTFAHSTKWRCGIRPWLARTSNLSRTSSIGNSSAQGRRCRDGYSCSLTVTVTCLWLCEEQSYYGNPWNRTRTLCIQCWRLDQLVYRGENLESRIASIDGLNRKTLIIMLSTDNNRDIYYTLVYSYVFCFHSNRNTTAVF